MRASDVNPNPTAASPVRVLPQRETPRLDRRFRLEWLALGLAVLVAGGCVAFSRELPALFGHWRGDV